MTELTEKLQALAAQLSPEEQATLLDYAEFLVSRSSYNPEPESNEPVDVPRPTEESVVAAMRRLSQTYPMLNMDKLLHEASGLMSEHIMQGRAAVEVIDDLQVLFDRYYQQHISDTK